MEEQTPSPVPDLLIFQNSRTRTSAIWTKEKGEWVDAEPKEYEVLGLLARLIRTTPNPSKIMVELAKQAKQDCDAEE